MNNDTKNVRKISIIHNETQKEIFEKYGLLILTIGHLEWFLRECLIFIILNSKFNKDNPIHNVLAEYISGLTFDKKVLLIQDFKLLSSDLSSKIEIIRKRRNIFIHGIILQHPNEQPTIELIRKRGKEIDKEAFNLNNISSFLDYVELVGGTLVSEFELKGFRLAQ